MVFVLLLQKCTRNESKKYLTISFFLLVIYISEAYLETYSWKHINASFIRFSLSPKPYICSTEGAVLPSNGDPFKACFMKRASIHYYSFPWQSISGHTFNNNTSTQRPMTLYHCMHNEERVEPTLIFFYSSIRADAHYNAVTMSNGGSFHSMKRRTRP